MFYDVSKKRCEEHEMKQIYAVLIMAMLAIYMLTGCNNRTIEIRGIDGEIVEVATKGLSDEQIDALERTAAGDSNIMSLLQSGLFTQEELEELNLFNADFNRELNAPGAFPAMDFSSIDIDELNLTGLIETQVDEIKKLLAGESTIQEVLESGLLTQNELTAIGLFPARTGSGTGREFKKPGSGN